MSKWFYIGFCMIVLGYPIGKFGMDIYNGIPLDLTSLFVSTFGFAIWIIGMFIVVIQYNSKKPSDKKGADY